MPTPTSPQPLAERPPGAARLPATRPGLGNLREALELFLRARDLAPLSRELYKRAINKFLTWLSDEAGRVHPAAVGVVYRDHLEKLHHGRQRTVATYLAPVKAFFKFLKAHGSVTVDPVESVRAQVNADAYRRPILTEDQVVKLLDSVNRTSITGRRDYALLMLILHTGLRAAETVSADVTDIETRDAVRILRVLGKGRKARDEYVVLTKPVVDALTEYLAATDRSFESKGPLFLAHNRGPHGGRLSKIGLQKAIERRLRAAGLKRPGLLVHSLRHVAATTALRHGASPFAVSKMLRHRSLSSTMIYLHDLDRLAAGAEYRVTYTRGNNRETGGPQGPDMKEPLQ